MCVTVLREMISRQVTGLSIQKRSNSEFSQVTCYRTLKINAFPINKNLLENSLYYKMQNTYNKFNTKTSGPQQKTNNRNQQSMEHVKDE